ncbi:hypothetical protein [Nocardia sp. NPDC048505]|uniref:hypothetical protein n=1 Tax=unclassified Nocardia TaxID=2637762 RepID=UPI0033C127FE
MYEYSLDWQYAADPTAYRAPQPCGYLIALALNADTKLHPDVVTAMTFDGKASYPGLGAAYDPVRKVVQSCGLIESLHWSGGPSEPIHLTFFTSRQNAQVLQAGIPLRTDEVSEFKFWVADYVGPGGWFESAYPMGTWPSGTGGALRGTLSKSGTSWAIDVQSAGTRMRGAKVEMFACSMSIDPGSDGIYTLFRATSAADKRVLPWGIKVTK